MDWIACRKFIRLHWFCRRIIRSAKKGNRNRSFILRHAEAPRCGAQAGFATAHFVLMHCRERETKNRIAFATRIFLSSILNPYYKLLINRTPDRLIG